MVSELFAALNSKQTLALLLVSKLQSVLKKLLRKFINKKDPQIYKGSILRKIKDAETSFLYYWKKVSRCIEQNILKVTGLTLKVLEKEAKL